MSKKKSKKKKQVKINEGVANLDEVDVSYDPKHQEKELNFESEEVKDRF